MSFTECEVEARKPASAATCSPAPANLAEELALLLEGAIVTAQVSETGRRAAKVAKTAAAALIDQEMARSDKVC